MSDKIVVLDEGKIAQCSSPIEIMSQASCHFVEEFIVNQLAIKQQNIQQIFSAISQYGGLMRAAFFIETSD